jgi:hypothetical protein
VVARERSAQEAWRTAQWALTRVPELFETGKTADAQRAALTFAILVDKSAALEAAAQQALDREQRIAAGQGAELAKRMIAALAVLGLDFPPVRRVMVQALVEEVSPQEDVEHARSTIRQRLGVAGLDQPCRQEPLELPSPS